MQKECKTMQKEVTTRYKEDQLQALFYEWDAGGKSLVAIRDAKKPDEFFDYEQLPDEAPAPQKAEFVSYYKDETTTQINVSDVLTTAGQSVALSGIALIKGVAILLEGLGRFFFWIGTVLIWLFPVRFKWPKKEHDNSYSSYERTTYYHHEKYTK